MNDTTKGALIASLVAGLVGCSSSPPPEAASPGGAATTAGTPVMCSGINECGAKGACKSADHDCAGKNKCKGQGLTKVNTADECTSKGGKVM
ncbi:MAG TPA: hypothetical protein VFS43_05605 [Polyangiaceae bacterium]|nr:hypothetical protein [Polyangiaceae bacterium]